MEKMMSNDKTTECPDALSVPHPAGAGEERFVEEFSEAQIRILKWLGKGWIAHRSSGSAVAVNGERICNAATMVSLCRRGLTVEQGDGMWAATESGKTITRKLEL